MAAGDGVGVTPRVASVTLSAWEKKLHMLAYQRFPTLRALKTRGRIRGINGGGEIRWPLRTKRGSLSIFADALETPFARLMNTANAHVPICGYDMTDGCTQLEMDQNQGEAAIVRYIAQKQDQMGDDALMEFAAKVYVDGLITTGDLHGLETFMSIGAQTNTDQFATVLNGTYGGLSTAYTTFGAAGTSGYGIWSPVIVNTRREVNGSDQLWDDFGDQYLRSGILQATYGDAEGDKPDMILCRRASFESFLNLKDDKERVILSQGSTPKEVAYGWEPQRWTNQDGVPVSWDFAITGYDEDLLSSGTDRVHAYGFNTSQMELLVLNALKQKDKIFTAVSDYDVKQLAEIYKLYMYGNWKFNSPRYFVKWADIADVAS